MSSYIRRIISMRDADGPRKKPLVSSKEYAMACPPQLYDDSESDDADDEYETGDEYLLISSPDTQSDESEGSDTDRDVGASKGDSGILDIIEDYFSKPTVPLYQRFDDIVLESSEAEEDAPPVVKFDPAIRVDTAVKGGVSDVSQDRDIIVDHDLQVLEQSISLREGVFALQQQDEDAGDDTDDWEIASVCCCDSWAFELEVAEEDHAAREEERLAVAKVRCSDQTSRISPGPAQNDRRRDRKVAFAVRPNVFGED
ncbi:hypothetical protein PG985_015391 [Apiospora marii]|uniref:Uncharacterized protein n=1 Tax=Apiospora marii TaxID=335849 RepID=A0ABR1S5S3_9PEZI